MVYTHQVIEENIYITHTNTIHPYPYLYIYIYRNIYIDIDMDMEVSNPWGYRPSGSSRRDSAAVRPWAFRSFSDGDSSDLFFLGFFNGFNGV